MSPGLLHFAQLVVTGLVIGSVYSLVALGFVLILLTDNHASQQEQDDPHPLKIDHARIERSAREHNSQNKNREPREGIEQEV